MPPPRAIAFIGRSSARLSTRGDGRLGGEQQNVSQGVLRRREASPVSGPRGANSFVASHERPHGRVTVSARPISPEYLGVFGT